MEVLCQRSSGVEQLIRNQQVAGSIPIAGSSKIKRLANMASLFFPVCMLLPIRSLAPARRCEGFCNPRKPFIPFFIHHFYRQGR